MFDFHLTPELLQAVARGAFPVDLLQRVMLAHAVRVSPHARRELDLWRFERSGADVVGQIGGGRYGDVFERLRPRLEAALETAERQHSQAERELAELACLPAADRTLTVLRSRRRFRSPALVEGALAAAWSELDEDRTSAGAWAEIALWGASRLEIDPQLRETLAAGFRSRAQALGTVARCLDEPERCLVELEGIRCEARQTLGHAPDLEAEFGVLEAFVLRRQGLTRQAAESLRRVHSWLDELEPEDRPWLNLAERELAALGG